MNNQLALEKMKAYCAYQERCHKDVVSKLYDLKIYAEEAEEIIITLIQENFLNEQRFAEAYVSGKFRIKKWGRIKIKALLKQKGISDYCIKKGFNEIEEDDYLLILDNWIEKLEVKYSKKKDYEKKGLIAKFLIQKGFESNLIWDKLKDL